MEKESVTCVECSSKFSKRANLLAHVNKKHPEKLQMIKSASLASTPLSSTTAYCADCKMKFSKVSNLRRHVQKKHPDKIDTLCSKRKFKVAANCEICEKPFSRARDLTKHIRLKHSDIASHKCKDCEEVFDSEINLKNHSKIHNLQNLLKCPMCGYLSDKKELINHYEMSHSIKVESSNLEFPSSEQFLQWKREMEIETVSSFINNHGSYKTANSVKCTYVCHRSGYIRLRGQGKRCLKTQGSKKINGYCPSCIEVCEENGMCKVRFVKTHIGHKQDLGHIFLNSLERQQLASKIATGIPLEKILNEVRESVPDSPLQRIHLLTKKDLYNIKSCYRLNSLDSSNAMETTNEENDVLQRKKAMIADFLQTVESVKTTEELDAVQGILTPIGSTLETLRQRLPAKSMPTPCNNEKIQSQRRRFTTSKKFKKPTRSQTKPSPLQSDTIVIQLLNT